MLPLSNTYNRFSQITAYSKVCFSSEPSANGNKLESVLIGNSSAIQGIRRQIKLLAQQGVPILLTGETGTGKTIAARAIHDESLRSKETFVPLNCGGVNPQFVLSDMFGHKKGAFTGATEDRKGLMPTAHRGTAFLDEVGDADPIVQQALLTFLEDGQYRPLGSDDQQKVDVRVIAASNKKLEGENSATRPDLFYRLNRFPIEFPPLKDRPEDIAPIALAMVERMKTALQRPNLKGLSPSALNRLVGYHWPGNLRELGSIIERAIVMAGDKPWLEADDILLPAKKTVSPVTPTSGLKSSTNVTEKVLIEQTLAATKNNRTKTAAILGISRVTLYKKMKKYGLMPGKP